MQMHPDIQNVSDFSWNQQRKCTQYSQQSGWDFDVHDGNSIEMPEALNVLNISSLKRCISNVTVKRVVEFIMEFSWHESTEFS